MATKYVKLDQRSHVLKRPGMYIGSIVPDTDSLWIFNSETNQISQKNVQWVPGLYKIFDEIVVNALDQIKRLKHSDTTTKQVKEIRVTIDEENGEISVYNDGDGIETNYNDKHEMYDVELIFGNLLTSSNYDAENDKLNIGGQNGIGSKACNIFSKQFSVETVDAKKKKIYRQTWSNNMLDKTQPKIERYTKYPYTKITFTPDYEKFGLDGITSDIARLFRKRVYDLCALTDVKIKVFLNDDALEIRGFEKYVELYNTGEEKPAFDSNEKWNVGAMFSGNGFQHMSFVNGICTQKGGKHVEYVTSSITKKLAELISKRRKASVKPVHIRDNLFVFVNAKSVDGATFDSQTKDTLTTPASKFGSKWTPDPKLIEKLYKTRITEQALNLSSVNDTKNAAKSDGKLKKTIRIPKLDDANFAGTAKSKECSLILTEGDSAKSMAIAGLSVVGRDKWGVFPLKGKVLNVKDQATSKVNSNEEISNLKKILGLESGRKYDSVDSLRYGRVVLMTDQDVDGTHIKSLVFNLFHSLWPSLMRQPKFLTSILTPIVKATKGKTELNFYTLAEYQDWQNETRDSAKYKTKYFKGLGTSTSAEAKEYFKTMLTANYEFGEDTDSKMKLAFDKKLADSRKEWMSTYDKDNRNLTIDCRKQSTVKFEEFIDKDLIHYSVYALQRSIPSVIDGFKQSIRKIMHGCLKKRLYSEIKVAQLAGYISENCAYHHGENSLQEAIVGLAQDFVGSNNLNLLLPKGQFGSRLLGGRDSASPRYIFTELNPIVKSLLPEDDMSILTYLEDDGTPIEPEYYVPTVPLLLINGSTGIATGYSTAIPSYDVRDIIANLKRLLKGETTVPMTPHFRGFTGYVDDEKTKGVYRRISANKVEVTELPVGLWTSDYKSFLDGYVEKNPKVLKDFESHYTETLVRFVLIFQSKAILDDMLSSHADKGSNGSGSNDSNDSNDSGRHVKFDTEFKMITTKPVSKTNMHAFDSNGKIKKYESELEILEEFFKVRMLFYEKRKEQKLKDLEIEIESLDSRMKFILCVIDGELKILNQTRDSIEQQLLNLEFTKRDGSYDYLVKLPIQSLTLEKKEELLNQYTEKDSEYKRLKKQSIQDMYETDLESLEKVLKSDKKKPT